MKTMKKVISVLMMVCILASFMTVAAYADGEVDSAESVTLSATASSGATAGGSDAITIAAYTGDTVTITPNVVTTGKATKAVTWDSTLTSSSEGVYTMPETAGTYTVTVTTVAGNNITGAHPTATCTINVAKKVVDSPAVGSISAQSNSVMIGNSVKLRLNLVSGKFAYWKVDSLSAGYGTIAVADNIEVDFNANRVGDAKISAIDNMGNVIDTITIKVTDKRTLEVATNVTRIDNGEVVWFYVKNAESSTESFTWSYSTTPATLSIVTATSSASAPNFSVTGGKGNGNVTVTATSANGETGSVTVPVNSLGYGDATLSPTNVNWAKGQGNLTFTVSPLLYAAYMDDVCFTGSGNTSKYNYVYSSSNLVINSSFLATLSAGQHVLRVDTVDANGNNAGTQYAYITVSGTASAAYGDNAHVRGTTSDLYFTANSAINSVTISGTTIDPANYTLSNNGKTITLKANFLNLLNYGSYTMKLGNTNGGTETATFRVVTANYAPATGDESNLAIWIAVMVISGAGAIALIPRKKKEM